MARVQLALNVADLERSVEFYSTLFGTTPHKRRPGYANFAIADPPLKLVLIEVPADQRGEGTAQALNHLGIEVDSSAEVTAGADRLRGAGLAAFDERDTTCCHALQDKVWVHDPAGAPWEVYTVKDDNPEDGRPATASLPLVGAGAAASNDGACCTSAQAGGAGSAIGSVTAPVNAKAAVCC